MDRQRTSCVHRANTFFGTFEVHGAGEAATVRVSYNGIERDARLDGFPADLVAHLVLRDLVRLDVERGATHAADRRRDRGRRPAPESHRLLDL